MRDAWQYQRDLEEARAKAETALLESIINEAFQEGVKRGRFETSNVKEMKEK